MCELEADRSLTDAELDLLLPQSPADRALTVALGWLEKPRTESRCFFCSEPTKSLLQICDKCHAVGERLRGAK